ncbi:MAG: uracil phosphoribosyltransferase [Bacilli bacterium]|nr:uracil phosphoribosyltransferase [Bacilli bacterium]
MLLKKTIKEAENVIILNHPLIKHKITILRDKNTKTEDFRRIMKEVSLLIGYEVFRNLETENILVETPLESALQPKLKKNKICFVPVLRAGLGMLDGFNNLINDAKIGHIGLYRDLKTHLPKEYFNKLPKNIKDMTVYLLDPMLATGESAINAVNLLKKNKVKKIIFVCIIASPEGVKNFCKYFKNIPLFIGSLDKKLDSNKYILPGLGDAGDRFCGTND